MVPHLVQLTDEGWEKTDGIPKVPDVGSLKGRMVGVADGLGDGIGVGIGLEIVLEMLIDQGLVYESASWLVLHLTWQLEG